MIIKYQKIKMGNKINKKKKLKKEQKDKNNEINVKILDTINYEDDIYLFIIIKTIYDEFNIICINRKSSIISYNLLNKQLINEIKKAHQSDIIDIRHYQDFSNKRDLLISLGDHSNKIKLWNLNNLECLAIITNFHGPGESFSICFLNDNNQIYILTSHFAIYGEIDTIKIYDLNGERIKELKDTQNVTYFIDTYFDKKTFTNYILTGNYNGIESYNYNKNEIYHTYIDKDSYSSAHNYIVVDDINIDIKLFELSNDGKIRIWNFHSGDLINRIEINGKRFCYICLLDNEHILAQCDDKTIKEINIKNNLIINNLIIDNEDVKKMKNINHPKYGNVIISNCQKCFKLWINK